MIWPFNRKPAPAPAARVDPVLARPAPQPARARSYAGALVNRLTSDWSAPSSSADTEINSSLRVLRNRSRQVMRDYDFAKSAKRSILSNVVGTGVKLQMQVPMVRGAGKLHKGVNDEIETAWLEWCRKENCDVAGKLTFPQIERLVLSGVVESGEILVRRINTERFGKSVYPFALEVIEADQLADDHNGEAPGGNQIRMGVEVNKWGRPVAYWLYDYHPGDYQFSTRGKRELRRIPADEIRHIFIVDRPGQTRGVPWLHAGLNRVRHTQGFEEAEVIGNRIASCAMGVIETPAGTYPEDGEDADGMPVIDMAPGSFERLAPGEQVKFHNPTKPSGNYDPFVRAQNRGLAAGLGTAYEDTTGDYSQSNYSSSRLALLNNRDNWRWLQGWLVSELHQWVFESWLEQAAAWGAINLPDFRNTPERFTRATRWRPRGWSWIDPSKEVDAAVKSVRAGMTTLTDVVAEQGGDLEELLKARAAEVALIKSYGLDVTTDPSAYTDQGQAQAEPTAKSDAGETENEEKENDGSDGKDSAAAA